LAVRAYDVSQGARLVGGSERGLLGHLPHFARTLREILGGLGLLTGSTGDGEVMRAALGEYLGVAASDVAVVGD
jgi:hypothetical protein